MNHDICLVVENSPYKTVRWILFLQNFSYIKFASQISSVSFSHKGEKQFFVWRTVLCRNSIEDWNLENYEEVFFFFQKSSKKSKPFAFGKTRVSCFAEFSPNQTILFSLKQHVFHGIFPKTLKNVFLKKPCFFLCRIFLESEVFFTFVLCGFLQKI